MCVCCQIRTIASPGLLVQPDGLCTPPSSGCGARSWTSATWDSLLLEAEAAYIKTVISKHNQMFRRIAKPRVIFSSCQPSCCRHVVYSVCHLEFQCIEGVVGGAAEGPLSDHLHRVNQLITMSPQRTSQL